MTAKNELDRALGAWFESTAPTHAPSQLTDRILASTRGARRAWTWRGLPGLGFRSPAGSHPIGTRALLLIISAAVLALLLGIIALGGGSSLRLGLGPTASPQTSPAPSPAATGPIVIMPTNLKPTLTVEGVERQVQLEMEQGHVGLASGPIVVTNVTLLGPGDTYDLSIGGEPMSFTSDGLSWVVEVTGTHVICSSFCDDAMAGFYRIDDATGYFSGGGHRPPFGGPVPSEDFRQLLARNGLQYSPVSTPPAGIVDAAKIVQGLDPHVFPLGGTLLGPSGKPYIGPLLGRLSIVDAAALQATEVPFVVPPNGTTLIWWIQSLERQNGDEQLEWQAFDATTGRLLLSNVH